MLLSVESSASGSVGQDRLIANSQTQFDIVYVHGNGHIHNVVCKANSAGNAHFKCTVYVRVLLVLLLVIN